MSHSHGRAFSDKQNVFHAFSKHVKPSGKSCSPVNLCTPNLICSSFDKNTDTKHGQKHKIKRLKKRKERSQLRDEGGGSNIRSQGHRHHKCCKEKATCHNCCQSSSHHHPRRDAPFARVFPTVQEPSIITDSRLIGHQGLFNHEVKSIDIERLLSEQRKLEKLGQHRIRKNNSTSLPPPLTPPPSSPVPDCDTGDVAVTTTEEAPNKKKAERTTTSTKTQRHDECKSNLDSRSSKCPRGDTHEDVGRRKSSIQVHLEEEISASNTYSQGTDITPEQRQTHQGTLTSSDSDAVLLSRDTSSNAIAAKRMETRPMVPEIGRELLLPHGGEQENSRPQDTQMNALTREGIGRLHSHKKSCSPSPKLTKTLSSDRRGTTESSDPQQTGTVCRPDPVSAVAARLCRSLELPLLCQRHLLAESREVMLQALRERHGPQLQENIMSMQRHISFSSRPTTVRHGWSRGPGVDGVDGVWTAATFDAVTGESGMEQPCIVPDTAGLKRKRRVSPGPPQPHREPVQGLNLSVPWTSNPSVEQVEDVFEALFSRPPSSHFLMDIQPPAASSPHHLFDRPSASYWGPAFPPQPSDEEFNRGTRETTSMDCFESWRYDPDLSFLNETGEVRERSTGGRQSFQQYLVRPPEGNQTHLLQRQDPFELQRSHFSSSSSSVLQSHQFHPFYRFNSHPPSPTPVSHCPDMSYPSSHMLESGLSPPRSSLPVFPSPERWSFPRMRLY